MENCVCYWLKDTYMRGISGSGPVSCDLNRRLSNGRLWLGLGNALNLSLAVRLLLEKEGRAQWREGGSRAGKQYKLRWQWHGIGRVATGTCHIWQKKCALRPAYPGPDFPSSLLFSTGFVTFHYFLTLLCLLHWMFFTRATG